MRNAHYRTQILRRKLKNLKNENCTLYDLEYGKKKNQEKRGKTKMHIVGPGIWQKTLKNVEMRNAHVGPGISCEIVKNVQNEKCTLYDLEYGKKH